MTVLEVWNSWTSSGITTARTLTFTFATNSPKSAVARTCPGERGRRILIRAPGGAASSSEPPEGPRRRPVSGPRGAHGPRSSRTGRTPSRGPHVQGVPEHPERGLGDRLRHRRMGVDGGGDVLDGGRQ